MAVSDDERCRYCEVTLAQCRVRGADHQCCLGCIQTDWRCHSERPDAGFNGDVHVYPVGDLMDHDTDTGDCVCIPTVEPVKRDDGSVGWLLTHHSLDNREAREDKP